jgi:tetrapyrrole methylase family protein/MazG family protein
VHPSAHLVGDVPSFDHRYDEADTFDEVYRAHRRRPARSGRRHTATILYAVPGRPGVGTHRRPARRGGRRGRVELEVLPAMSFVDLAWVRLGVDPYEQGVRLIDGHRFEVAAAGERGPLLVAHCHNRRVLSDMKLAVDEPTPSAVVLLQRLGLPDEAVTDRRVGRSGPDRRARSPHLDLRP